MAKHIFVTGGVSSSLGKGLTGASLGRLLKSRGVKVTMQKLDPYINVDPGTMNPFEHGEVFVTGDGGETDLDLGHYERFIDENLTKTSNATTGSIYQTVIEAERRGEFLGKTIQIIPHITDEIKRRITAMAEAGKPEVVITEIGGTVGDIEILPFLEAIRQFRLDVGKENVCYVHVTLVPYIAPTGEQKTKPTQHSVTELRSRGVQPDVIVCRSSEPVSEDIRHKISRLCDVPTEAVINMPDVENIYEIPLILHKDGFDSVVCKVLGIKGKAAKLDAWHNECMFSRDLSGQVRIGIIGKYIDLMDAYLSVAESLRHGGFHNGCSVDIKWINSEGETDGFDLEGLDGIVIPGGFGDRGIEGKIWAAKFARENNLPCLGLCLGMQAMTIDYARNVLGMKEANSSEFDFETPDPVIDLMSSQKELKNKGGTMRLGTYTAKLQPGSQVEEIYGTDIVQERHRHRYEFNPKYREQFNDGSFLCSGESKDGELVEFIELKSHPYWIGTQAHPEFQSRPNRPAPLFKAFVEAALDQRS